MKRNRVHRIKKVHIAGIITAVIIIIAGLFVRPLVAKALFDEKFASDIESKVCEVRHIELADENDFQNKFLNAMELKEWYYK